MADTANANANLLNTLKKDKALRKAAIEMLSKDFPREFLSRVKVDMSRSQRLLSDIILVSCKEWQE